MTTKRFQVFVSSTFQDLQEERQEVMQALLELDCIPSGMELFPAANDDQWTLIKKVIDDCDYYMVIIAGRYGSLGSSGLSYTEMEYRYATEKGKPVVAFLHRSPGTLAADRCEATPAGREKLEAFRHLAQQKMVKFWESPADLGSVVSRSIIMLMRNTPAVGWVRADALPDESTTEELLRLRTRVSELEVELAAANTSAPAGAEHFAQGTDRFPVAYHAGTRWNRDAPIEEVSYTWNELFAAVAPIMIDEASESDVRSAVENLIADSKPLVRGKSGPERFACRLSDRSFASIIVQLRALGLITKSMRRRSLKNNDTYWTLTPYGDNHMTSLRAIRRVEVE